MLLLHFGGTLSGDECDSLSRYSGCQICKDFGDNKREVLLGETDTRAGASVYASEGFANKD